MFVKAPPDEVRRVVLETNAGGIYLLSVSGAVMEFQDMIQLDQA